MEDGKNDQLKPLKTEVQNEASREAISMKPNSIASYDKLASNIGMTERKMASLIVNDGNSQGITGPISSGLASKWESMKISFQSLSCNIGSKRFLPLHQIQETKLDSCVSMDESIDDIFQRLKQPTIDRRDYIDDEWWHTYLSTITTWTSPVNEIFMSTMQRILVFCGMRNGYWISQFV